MSDRIVRRTQLAGQTGRVIAVRRSRTGDSIMILCGQTGFYRPLRMIQSSGSYVVSVSAGQARCMSWHPECAAVKARSTAHSVSRSVLINNENSIGALNIAGQRLFAPRFRLSAPQCTRSIGALNSSTKDDPIEWIYRRTELPGHVVFRHQKSSVRRSAPLFFGALVVVRAPSLSSNISRILERVLPRRTGSLEKLKTQDHQNVGDHEILGRSSRGRGRRGTSMITTTSTRNDHHVAGRPGPGRRGGKKNGPATTQSAVAPERNHDSRHGRSRLWFSERGERITKELRDCECHLCCDIVSAVQPRPGQLGETRHRHPSQRCRHRPTPETRQTLPDLDSGHTINPAHHERHIMSNETTLVITGNLTDDPKLTYTQTAKAVVGFTVASTPRTFDKETNGWKDGNTLFMRVSAWGLLAENVAESLTKGTRVVVTGRLGQRSYETKEGENRTVIELTADEVAASLTFATVKVNKAERNGATGGGGSKSSSVGTSSKAKAEAFDDEPPFAHNTPTDI